MRRRPLDESRERLTRAAAASSVQGHSRSLLCVHAMSNDPPKLSVKAGVPDRQPLGHNRGLPLTHIPDRGNPDQSQTRCS